MPLGRPQTRGGRSVAPSFVLALLLAAAAALAGTVTDMAKRSVDVPAPARRVVSLLPSITETAFALGRGDRIVGRTSYCEQPPEALALPVVGDIANPGTEAVLVLQPDLILAADIGVNLGALDSLAALGLPVYQLNFKDYETTLESIVRMGELLAAQEKAQTLVAEIRAAAQDVRKRTQGLPRPRVLVAISHGPAWVAGKETFLDEFVEAAGGVNAIEIAGYGARDTEQLLMAAPDVVLVAEIASQMPSAMEFWNGEALAELPARKAGRVVPLETRVTVPGPHMRESFYQILRAIHPEAAP